MSPPTVVTFRAPPETVYLVASGRTIAFQRVAFRLEPPNESPDPMPVCGTFGPSIVIQSNSGVTVVAAAFESDTRPIIGFAGRFAARPTLVHVWPLLSE